MNREIKVFIILLLLVQSMQVLSQVDNNFWFVVPEITYRHNSGDGEPTVFRMASLGDTVVVTITMPARGDILAKILIPAGEYAEYNLTPLIRNNYVIGDYYSGDHNESNIIESGLPGTEGTVSDRGIHIVSRPYNSLKGDDRITVYLDRFNPNNRDIWSLKGKNGLGKDFTIISQNYSANRSSYRTDPDGWVLNAFDIVATKDGTTVTITPSAEIKNQKPGLGYKYPANTPIPPIDLNAGETFSCVATDVFIGNHLGGSIVTSNEDIAITLKDDSMAPSGGGVDTGGDQLIPDTLGGKEFVIMRGEITNGASNEYVFVMSTKDGSTNVTYNAIGGGTNTITLNGRGAIDKIPLKQGASTIDALHLIATEKVMAWHITGFNNEVGAALIPSIDLCTGSTDVTVVRSLDDIADTERFFLNLMTKFEHIDDFTIFIDVNGDGKYGVGEDFALLATDFEQGGTSDWWYLKKGRNEFSTNATSPIGQQAIQNSPLRVVNPGRFHLGTIEGGGSGAKYGYFSNFAADEGDSSFDDDGEVLQEGKYCFGDTIFVDALGGKSYNWFFPPGEEPDDYEILGGSDATANLVMILRPQNGFYDGSVNVEITRECVITGDPVITVDNGLQVLAETKPDFDTSLQDINLCSPVEYEISQNSERYSWNYWSIENASGTYFDTIQYKSTALPYSKVIEFENYGLGNAYYKIKHVTRWEGVSCADSVTKVIKVFPQVIAKSESGYKSGCSQFIERWFLPAESSTVFTHAWYEWGDGQTSDTISPAQMNDTVFHTFFNNSIYDTTYYPKLVVYNDTCACISSFLEVPVVVPGKIFAKYGIEYQGSDKCSPLDVKFTNNTNGDVNYRWWFFKGNDTVGAATADYDSFFNDTIIPYTNTSAEPDTFFVFLHIDQKGTTCFDEFGPDTIIVFPEPDVDIIPDPIATICHGDSINFNSSLSPVGLPVNYYWTFGNGNTSSIDNPAYQTYNHYQSTQQNFDAKLVVISDYGLCNDTATVNFNVASYIDAQFTLSPDNEGCAPFEVEIDNTTSAASENNLIFDLDGGGGSSDLNAPFNVTYENTGTSTINRKVRLLNSNANGCNVGDSVELTIYPQITASFTSSSTLICNGQSITFTNASHYNNVAQTSLNGSGATYLWDFGDGATSILPNPTHSFVNTVNSGILAQDFTVTLTATLNGCSETYQQIVSVYPKITPQFNSDDYVVCAPENVLIINESTGADTYLWEFSDGGTDASTTDVTYNFTNTTLNTIQTTTVKLTATNDICNNSVSKNYKIYPELVANFSADVTEGCAPLDVVFTNSSTGGVLASGDLTVNWDYNDGDLQSNTANTVQHTFDNKSAIDIIRTVKLVIENGNGCKDSTTAPIDVWPELIASFTFSKDGNCSPDVVTIENTSLNGSNFEWDYGFDSQTDITSNKDPLVVDFYHTNANLNAKDIYTIELIATDANHPQCTDVFTKPITIYPPIVPDFDITANDIGCSPLNSNFSNISTGYKLRYIWDYGDGNTSSAINESHLYRNLTSANANYNVTLVAIDSLNCSDNVSSTVTVYPEVVAKFTYLKDSVCTPFPVEFSYPETAINGSRWEWEFGDGTSSLVDDAPRETFEHTFDNTGATVVNYSVELIAIDQTTNCRDTSTQTIEVYPRLVPGFISDLTEGCNPLTVNFTNQTTGIANYNWDFKDGQSSSITSPEHIFSHLSPTDKDYNVTLTTVQENTGCTKTISDIITVYSFVDASFGLAKVESKKASKSDIVGGCHPFEVEIVDSSKTNGTWAWDYGDGNTANVQQPGIRTYLNTDNTKPLELTQYEVKLQVTNSHGCFDRDSTKLVVYPRSVPDFSVDNEGCHPHRVFFSDESVVDDETRYFWRLGDGSTKVDDKFSYTYLNYSYTEIDTFYVNLRTTTEFGCADSVTQTIIVRPSPSAEIVPIEDRGCPPFKAFIENRSQGVNLKHYWKMYENADEFEKNNLTTEQYTYYNNSPIDEIRTFYPYLRVENEFGCSDSDTAQIFVFPNVLVGFSSDVKEGCSPLAVNFANNSNRSAKIFDWQFGDQQSSGSKNPVHIYYNETVKDVVYTVKLHAESEYGCWAEYEDTISVYLTPVVDFEAIDPVQLFPETVITFKNLTQPGPWTHTWDLGNNDEYITQSLASFDYDYKTWGPKENDYIYPVTLHVSSGQCEAEKSHNVKIIAPVPTVKIQEITPPAGCEPHTATFRLHQENGNTWEWDFGNGETSNDSTVTYTFDTAGFYNIMLTVDGDGGVWYDYNIVEVYPKPIASFIVSPELVMLPDQEIQTYNTTKNGEKFYWDFGDGTIVIDESPSHLYTSVEGSPYTITLVAESEKHCLDTAILDAAVRVDGTGAIDFPNAFLPNDASSSDGSYDEVDIDNNIFHPVYYGVKDFQMWIFNRWGEQIFYSDDILVGWNGKVGNNGKKLGQDVYFWKAKGKYENGVSFKKSGDVTLIIK